MNQGNCKSCNAPIYWLKHERTGNTAPIDALPVMEGGNVAVNLTTGTWKVADMFDEKPRHTNHFQTCPQAKEHKKR